MGLPVLSEQTSAWCFWGRLTCTQPFSLVRKSRDPEAAWLAVCPATISSTLDPPLSPLSCFCAILSWQPTRVKEESEKAGLKLNIQKTKTVASGPVTSWQIEGDKAEAVTNFTFLGSKITADGDCSHEFKRCLLIGRNAMTNLDSILESRDITLLTKVHIIKAIVFPVVMHGCESWTTKKVEAKKWMLSNCAAGKDYRESLVLQRDQTSQS